MIKAVKGDNTEIRNHSLNYTIDNVNRLASKYGREMNTRIYNMKVGSDYTLVRYENGSSISLEDN